MSTQTNNVVITIAGPMRSGKTVIAAVIKQALLDAGIPETEILYGTTGIYANSDNRANASRNMKYTTEALIDKNGDWAMRPEDYPFPRTIHILEDMSDNNVVQSAEDLKRR